MSSRLVAGLLAVLCLAGCTRGSVSRRTPSGALKVVAIENVWGDIIRQIGGAHVSVTSILTDPSVDPHTYETDPRAAAAISGAAFVVENGLGYDDFASKLLRASGAKDRRVVTVSDLLMLSGHDVNPHLWYSPTYVGRTATALVAELARADPANADAYLKGLLAFTSSYKPYVDLLASIKQQYAGAKVAYTERVPGYLLDAAGLSLGVPASFPRSIEDGNDPSLADVDAFTNALKSKTVRMLLYNAQVTSPVTDRLKKQAAADGVPVVGVTEMLPAGESFQEWQLGQAKAVVDVLNA